MNNKGFTMIEVISIIALLGIILAIAIPSFISTRDDNNIKEKDKLVELIINSGKLYFVNNNLTLGSNVTVETLCQNSYLTCPIMDPINNVAMDGYVTSYLNANNELSYRYEE